MKRATISDIARVAGLTKSSVSHALNDRPGVSEETRIRVKAIAAGLGWSANPVARALSGARAGAIGWVIRRSAKSNTIDPYFMEFFAGIEVELARTPTALVVKLVADEENEIRMYRQWAAERRVDGVVVVDLRVDDRRIGVLRDLGLPAAAFVSTKEDFEGLPRIWFDEWQPVEDVLDHAFDTGHRTIGWIAGAEAMHATQTRLRALNAWRSGRPVDVRVAFTDYGSEQGSHAAMNLLERSTPPTIIVFDNHLMALAGMGAMQRRGLRIPEDVSIISWLDSQVCEQVNPPITALRHQVADFGAATARRLLQVIEGERADDLQAAAPQLMARGSVADISAGSSTI